jgi:hypothetical protein
MTIMYQFQPHFHMKTLLRSAMAVILAATLTGCLTKRTVTQGGQTVSEEYVFKRPLKEAIGNSR